MKRLYDWARNGRGAAIADTIVAVGLATGAVAALDSVTSATGLGVVYLLAVLFVAIRRSEIAALATAVLSVLTLNYFFIEPRHQLTISDSENVVALIVFLVAGDRRREAGPRGSQPRRGGRGASPPGLRARARGRAAGGRRLGRARRHGRRAQLENLGTSVGAAAGASSVRLELSASPVRERGRVRRPAAHRERAPAGST